MTVKALIAGLSMGLALVAHSASGGEAARNLVVVELYTSQGCSSCPPADALLHKLSKRDDVLPLALHVDYWDYIGWKDIFARPEHTIRQKKYARVAGSRTIYTPQMVIGGDEQIVGTRPMDVADAVMKHFKAGTDIAVSVERDAGMALITATRGAGGGAPLLVQLVRYLPEQTVEIRHGENAGKTLSYANIVTDWQVLGEWSSDAPFSTKAPIAGEDAAAVILQEPGNGPILAAVRVD